MTDELAPTTTIEPKNLTDDGTPTAQGDPAAITCDQARDVTSPAWELEDALAQHFRACAGCSEWLAQRQPKPAAPKWFQPCLAHRVRPIFGSGGPPHGFATPVDADAVSPDDTTAVGLSYELCNDAGYAHSKVHLRLTDEGRRERDRRVAEAVAKLRQDCRDDFQTLLELSPFATTARRYADLSASRARHAAELAACETEREQIDEADDPVAAAERMADREARARSSLENLTGILARIHAHKLVKQRAVLVAGLCKLRWDALLAISDKAERARRDLCGLLDGRDPQAALMDCEVSCRLLATVFHGKAASDVTCQAIADELAALPAGQRTRVAGFAGVQVPGIDGKTPAVIVSEPPPDGSVDMNPVRVLPA